MNAVKPRGRRNPLSWQRLGRIRNVIAFALESTTTLRMHVHPSSRCTERVPNAVIGSRGSLPHPPPAAQQAQPPAQRSWAARRLRGCAARLLCAAGSAEDSWLRKGSCAAEYPVLTDRFSFPRQSELSSAPRTGEAESRTKKISCRRGRAALLAVIRKNGSRAAMFL